MHSQSSRFQCQQLTTKEKVQQALETINKCERPLLTPLIVNNVLTMTYSLIVTIIETIQAGGIGDCIDQYETLGSCLGLFEPLRQRGGNYALNNISKGNIHKSLITLLKLADTHLSLPALQGMLNFIPRDNADANYFLEQEVQHIRALKRALCITCMHRPDFAPLLLKRFIPPVGLLEYMLHSENKEEILSLLEKYSISEHVEDLLLIILEDLRITDKCIDAIAGEYQIIFLSPKYYYIFLDRIKELNAMGDDSALERLLISFSNSTTFFETSRIRDFSTERQTEGITVPQLLQSWEDERLIIVHPRIIINDFLDLLNEFVGQGKNVIVLDSVNNILLQFISMFYIDPPDQCVTFQITNSRPILETGNETKQMQVEQDFSSFTEDSCSCSDDVYGTDVVDISRMHKYLPLPDPEPSEDDKKTIQTPLMPLDDQDLLLLFNSLKDKVIKLYGTISGTMEMIPASVHKFCSLFLNIFMTLEEKGLITDDEHVTIAQTAINLGSTMFSAQQQYELYTVDTMKYLITFLLFYTHSKTRVITKADIDIYFSKRFFKQLARNILLESEFFNIFQNILVLETKHLQVFPIKDTCILLCLVPVLPRIYRYTSRMNKETLFNSIIQSTDYAPFLLTNVVINLYLLNEDGGFIKDKAQLQELIESEDVLGSHDFWVGLDISSLSLVTVNRFLNFINNCTLGIVNVFFTHPLTKKLIEYVLNKGTSENIVKDSLLEKSCSLMLTILLATNDAPTREMIVEEQIIVKLLRFCKCLLGQNNCDLYIKCVNLISYYSSYFRDIKATIDVSTNKPLMIVPYVASEMSIKTYLHPIQLYKLLIEYPDERALALKLLHKASLSELNKLDVLEFISCLPTTEDVLSWLEETNIYHDIISYILDSSMFLKRHIEMVTKNVISTSCRGTLDVEHISDFTAFDELQASVQIYVLFLYYQNGILALINFLIDKADNTFVRETVAVLLLMSFLFKNNPRSRLYKQRSTIHSNVLCLVSKMVGAPSAFDRIFEHIVATSAHLIRNFASQHPKANTTLINFLSSRHEDDMSTVKNILTQLK